MSWPLWTSMRVNYLYLNFSWEDTYPINTTDLEYEEQIQHSVSASFVGLPYSYWPNDSGSKLPIAMAVNSSCPNQERVCWGWLRSQSVSLLPQPCFSITISESLDSCTSVQRQRIIFRHATSKSPHSYKWYPIYECTLSWQGLRKAIALAFQSFFSYAEFAS